MTTTRCPTCWFATGDDTSHCGTCTCCPEPARTAARARNRTHLLVKIRDLTPAEERDMEALIAADQRDRETKERTRFD
jgi:hypothetical protein